MLGALELAIKALVLAGLPTTKIRICRLALSLIAFPCWVNILALASSKSFLSMPGPLGIAPTSKAYSASLKATFASSVAITSLKVEKAQSSSSMTTPCNAGRAGVISSSCNIIGWSLPNICPEAIRNAS